MPVDHLIDIIQPLPGIQRDGTQFNSKSYIDGQWCRFYLGLPKKIGGYGLIDPGTTEIIRNLYEVNKQNSVDIYIGRPSTLSFTNTTLNGIAAPESDRTPSGFVANSDNMWTFDLYTNPAVSTTITLGTNPIKTGAMGSGIITVTVTSTSIFVNGQQVTIANATTTDGVTALELNIMAPITIVDGTTFTYPTAGSASAGNTTGGGNSVTLTYTKSITYIIGHAAPNVSDINNNIQTNIYWGDINANTALTLIDPVYLPISSGGIVAYPPYLFMYGNNGVISYTLTPNNWSTAVNTPTDGTKIIKGILTRGGSNSPALLFFSMNSLIRVTFQGGTPPFNFDILQSGLSILSQNCVVTNFNVVYWIGINQFYLYNGVVRPLKNNMNKIYFFKNLNTKYRNKVFGWINELYSEVWWHYPSGDSTENNAVIIYNWEEERFYDSVLGRSAGYISNFLSSPILADSNTLLNKFSPTINITLSLPTDALATTNGSSTITVTLGVMTNLQSGNVVTISGATTFGGLTTGQLNVTSAIVVTSFANTPTVFTYTAGANATSTITAGGGSVMFYTQSIPNKCYGIWQHEQGTDMSLYGETLAIQSYFETNIKTIFEKNPSEDRNLRSRRIEPDFVQTGEMTLIVNYRSFAQSTIYSSPPYTFLPGQEVVELAKIDTTQMGRLVSFRFESNVVGGDYHAGKILLNYAAGDVRP